MQTQTPGQDLRCWSLATVGAAHTQRAERATRQSRPTTRHSFVALRGRVGSGASQDVHIEAACTWTCARRGRIYVRTQRWHVQAHVLVKVAYTCTRARRSGMHMCMHMYMHIYVCTQEAACTRGSQSQHTIKAIESLLPIVLLPDVR